MLLDSRILLLCLVIVSAALALSICIVAQQNEHGGLRKWAWALGLESVAWLSFAIDRSFPNTTLIIAANLTLFIAQAVKLAAIYEYRGLPWPRWQCMLPVLITLFACIFLARNGSHRHIVCGSLIYAAQMAMIAFALRHDAESRSGNAWHLLLGSTLAIMSIYVFRAIDSLSGSQIFTPLQTLLTSTPIQLTVFLFVIGLNITESMGFVLMIKQRSDREIRALAMIDPLTGIFNRRAFMEHAEKECAAAQRNRLPLALLMIDVDHFKKINDRYGHPAGDAVLAEIAHILTSRLRKQDTIGRYGGEEFCVLLPGTEELGAIATGESLRHAISATPLTQAGLSIAVTVSIGITVKPASEILFKPDFSKLLAAADTALYQAKHDGRNRIVILNSLRTAYTTPANDPVNV